MCARGPEPQIRNTQVNYKTPVILRKPLALASPLIQHYTLKLYKCMASQVRAGSNRRFLVLGLGWLSLESVGMWYKQRQLYKTTASPPLPPRDPPHLALSKVGESAPSSFAYPRADTLCKA